MKKLVISLSLMLSLAVAPSAAFASTGQQATLAGNFHITYDGVEQVFTDGNGSEVEPIVLDGTTYLPVRAVARLAGLDANWDSATRTVELITASSHTNPGTPSNTKVSSITVSPDSSIIITLDGKEQKTPAPFIYEGTTYLPVREVCNMVSIPVDWDAVTNTVVLGEKPSSAVTSPAAVTTSSAIISTPAIVTSSAVATIPKDAKVLTDKDMIDLDHEYKDGKFYVKSDAHNNPSIQLDFNTDSYNTVTFTVTTNDVGDEHSQNVFVVGRDGTDPWLSKGTLLLNLMPQDYGTTKTYTVNVSGYNVGEINVGAGLNSNAIVSNVYLSK